MAKVTAKINHHFDKTPLSKLLFMFSGRKKELMKFLKLRGEKDAAWRLRHYKNEDIKYENSSFEGARTNVLRRLERIKAQKELRFMDAWEDNFYVQALYVHLRESGVLDSKEDMYNLDEDYEVHEGVYSYTYNDDMSWLIALEDDAKDYAIDMAKNYIDEGVMSKEFLSQYIDGDRLARDMESTQREWVEESPDSYLDEDQRELADWQETEIEEKEEQIKTLREEQEGLDLDTPEDEQRYDEIEEEISDLETEIEDIKNDPQGDWDEEAIDEVVEKLLDEIKNDPLDWLKGMGYDMNDDFVKNYIDEDEAAEDAVRIDGVPHFLASYDGYEEYIKHKDNTYYIYRTN